MEVLKEFGITFLNLFLQYVLPPLVALLGGLAIAYVKKLIDKLMAQMSDDQLWYVERAVRAAVLAAEQVGLKDIALDKKEYALAAATNWLCERGIGIDLNTLGTMIESAVMSEFNKDKESLSATIGGTD